LSTDYSSSKWPSVEEHNWCGEFEAKAKAKAKETPKAGNDTPVSLWICTECGETEPCELAFYEAGTHVTPDRCPVQRISGADWTRVK
jgi:hypothetical protein